MLLSLDSFECARVLAYFLQHFFHDYFLVKFSDFCLLVQLKLNLLSNSIICILLQSLTGCPLYLRCLSFETNEAFGLDMSAILPMISQANQAFSEKSLRCCHLFRNRGLICLQILSFAYHRREAKNLICNAVAFLVVKLALIDSFQLALSFINAHEGLLISNL